MIVADMTVTFNFLVFDMTGNPVTNEDEIQQKLTQGKYILNVARKEIYKQWERNVPIYTIEWEAEDFRNPNDFIVI